MKKKLALVFLLCGVMFACTSCKVERSEKYVYDLSDNIVFIENYKNGELFSVGKYKAYVSVDGRYFYQSASLFSVWTEFCPDLIID